MSISRIWPYVYPALGTPHIDTRVLIYNKPEGEICSRDDPQNRPTVFANLPGLASGRWISVGRLDLNTTGLLVFTNDGDLAQALMHPSRNIEREYMVRVRRRLSDNEIKRLLNGVLMDGKVSRFESIREGTGGGGNNCWYQVILKQGRYREVRRLFEAVGVSVSRLKRIRFGPLKLPRDLATGCSRELEKALVNRLASPPKTCNE